MQDFAANFRPSQSGCQANFAFGRDTLLAELDWPQHFLHAISADHIFKTFLDVFGDELASHLAAAGTNLAFQIAHAGFARIVANNFQNTLVGEIKLFRTEAIGVRLLCHQVSFGDFEFFALGITGKTQYFETILERWRNCVQYVRGRDKENFG